MAFITIEKAIKNYQLIPQQEYAKLHEGITLQAIRYMIQRGDIDYTIVGNRKVLVMTEVTKNLTPRVDPRRGKTTSQDT